MGKTQFMVSALLLILLLAACAPVAAPAPAAPAPAAPAPQALAAPAKEAWQAEWEKTVAAAKQEGTVVLASSGAGADVRNALAKAFKDAHGLSLEAVSGRGGDMARKIMSERKAGLYNFDVFVGGSSTLLTMIKPAGGLDPLEPKLILPDLSDPEVIKKTWYQGNIIWTDGDHTVVAGLFFPDTPLAINTALVKPGEIVSYNDLLDPKWEGKLLFYDPTVTGASGGGFVPMAFDVLGRRWLETLAERKPTIIGDQRQMLEWLARGKAAIAIAPSVGIYLELKRAGAPIQVITPEEGTWMSAGVSSVAAINKAPHPNAATVFINWFLSKEGQTIFSKTYGGQSGRLDVPTDFLAPEQIRKPGGKYFFKEREEIILKGPEYLKVGKEIFGHLVK